MDDEKRAVFHSLKTSFYMPLDIPQPDPLQIQRRIAMNTAISALTQPLRVASVGINHESFKPHEETFDEFIERRTRDNYENLLPKTHREK